MKKILLFMLLIYFFITPNKLYAAGKILFIPHDDRPISYHQTVEVVESAGYEMILPPKNLLSNAENLGNPDELWRWLEENIFFANSAVIASDSMLYGGLIPSRKHEISQEKISERIENFKKIRDINPDLKIYVFDSLMRTPVSGTPGDIEEPEYYQTYGADIFQFTALADKKEISKLNNSEERYFDYLEKKIPTEILTDWLDRRRKNLTATKKLMDFARDGVIDYLILGRDDNSPLCQTHRENREILSYALKNNLTKSKFQSMPGIDEFNILLLNRAVNDMTSKIPFINVQYNTGKGGDTVPAFSDEKISMSIDSAIAIAGGLKIPSPERADFVLLVNTDDNGKTLWEHNLVPNGDEFIANLKPSASTKNFAKLVEDYINAGYSVGVADINFANGSDNALMNILQNKDLLFKLQTYSGWNTATNSTGFALATGIFAKNMSAESKNKILAIRYLDDWAYQANIRTVVGNELVRKFGSPTYYYSLGDKLDFAEMRNNELMREFAKKNLPQISNNFIVKNPWLRMFECDIIFK